MAVPEIKEEELLNKYFVEFPSLLKGIPERFDPDGISGNATDRVMEIGNKLNTLWEEERNGQLYLIPAYSAFFDRFDRIQLRKWKSVSTEFEKPIEKVWKATPQQFADSGFAKDYIIETDKIVVDPATYWFFMDVSYRTFKQSEESDKTIISAIFKMDKPRSSMSKEECTRWVERMKKIAEELDKPRVEEIIEED